MTFRTFSSAGRIPSLCYEIWKNKTIQICKQSLKEHRFAKYMCT